MEVRLENYWRVVIVTLQLVLLLSSCDGGKKENDVIKKKCDTCTSLVKHFKQGMERTARSMHEGGDADWEEKRLGSYATSEMRFIEISESLCESKEYDCHKLLETEEELLEKWWKEHQDDQPDLHKWFCIENYKVCCPENTFGPECEECPYGLERTCKGNGKCSGGGTRGGTGKCKCKAGYKGDLCDICKDGYHEVMKNETHTSCKACHKACTALCTSLGPKGCKKCKAGWLWDDEAGCEDVNECNAEEESPCKEDEFCENSEGSYKCGACDKTCDRCLGEGKDKCVKCKSGYEMKDDGCGDTDECQQEDICPNENMKCKNVPGSYYCDCEEGFERMGSECIDKSLPNNDTDQASAESSENLESATSQEGAIHASGSEGHVPGGIDTASIGEGTLESLDNLQIVEDSSNQAGNTEQAGQEIPTSPDDFKDVSQEKADISDNSEAAVDKTEDFENNIRVTSNSHEEL